MARKNEVGPTAASELALDQDYAAQLLGGLMESRTTVLATGGGKPLLRLLKEGVWVFGQSDDEVQEGSHWAVNVKTLAWGWVCWTNYPVGQKNKRLGLQVVPMTQARPARPEPIEGFAFTDFLTFDALCLDGDDEGVEVTYGTNSIGGTRAFTKLRDAIIAQLQKDIRFPCPVVTLGEESYKGAYGKTYNPILTITGWADLGGNLASTGQALAMPVSPQAPVAAPAEPVRKRKAPLGGNGAPVTAAPQEAPTPAEPVSTQQAHVGQRRRHRPAA
jgi:hypothetical protein